MSIQQNNLTEIAEAIQKKSGSTSPIRAIDFAKRIRELSGVGVPAGGVAGQVLAKASSSDYDTHWIDPPAGGGGLPLNR